jgi:hypothetical protein
LCCPGSLRPSSWGPPWPRWRGHDGNHTPTSCTEDSGRAEALQAPHAEKKGRNFAEEAGLGGEADGRGGSPRPGPAEGAEPWRAEPRRAGPLRQESAVTLVPVIGVNRLVGSER